jgi:class 3 adenylate cyclase
VRVTPQSFHAKESSIRAGPALIKIENATGEKIGITLFKHNFEEATHILAVEPNTFKPFPTGKTLLNNQTFRDLFRIPSLSRDITLSVRSLTLLFTDLKGSTDLYDRTGDAEAYALINRHFEVLKSAVRSHRGAVIKTMGDAIMAAFSEPDEGVACALEIMSSIKLIPLGQRPQALKRYYPVFDSLALKVGIHEGPALVINNDGMLDYFGQTVNIAARVQSLAQADEMYVTQSVFHSGSVREKIATAGCSVRARSVRLKGIGERTPVYQIRIQR